MAVYNIRLLDRKEIAEGTFAFDFEKPAGFTFRPGQFSEFTLINPPYTDAEGNTRPFSIASSPKEAVITFATRMRPTAFKKSLAEMPLGAFVSMEGPFGSFTLPRSAGKQIVILTGGIGVTPFRSMVKYAVEEKLLARHSFSGGGAHKILLFYSNRTSRDTAFLEELKSLEETNQNYHFIPTMTQLDSSGQSWAGERGYITKEMILKYIDNLSAPTYYIAGPQAFVAAMFQMLKLSGVEEDNIRTEEFPGY